MYADTLIIPVAIVVLIAAVILHATGRRALGRWLLVPFPALLCPRILHDLSRGAGQLGEGEFGSDQRQLHTAL